MNYKLGFTAHHVRKEVYFQTEPKYLVIFQSEKQDDIMIKEYEKKKKEKDLRTKDSVFSQGHFN